MKFGCVYIVNGIILECIIQSNLNQAKRSDTECIGQITDVGTIYKTTVKSSQGSVKRGGRGWGLVDRDSKIYS